MYYYKRKANPLKWLIIAVIFIVIGVLLYWFYINYFSRIDFSKEIDELMAEDDAIEELANVLLVNLSIVNGTVSADINNQGYKNISKNTILHQGDKVKTGLSGRAVLTLENGSIVRMNSNTEIILENLAVDNIYLKQLSGRTYHSFKKQGEYKIESLNVRVTALGTKFEFITNLDRQFLAVLDFSNKLLVEISDKDGLLVGSRLQANEKALIDLQADKNNLLKLEEFDSESLASEEWYKWNFDMDNNMGKITQPEDEDDEPDFSVTDESLELAAEAKEDSISLSWSVFNQPNFESYQIIKSETDQNLKYPETEVIKSSFSKSYNSYVDNDVEEAIKYYYRVCIIKVDDMIVCGNVSSAEIAKEEPDSIPPVTPNLSASISVKGVSLTWPINNEEDFKEYRVVKSLTNPLPVYPQDGFMVIKAKGSETWLDNQVNITSPGTYYYRVCSLDQTDNTACSNVKIIENGQLK